MTRIVALHDASSIGALSRITISQCLFDQPIQPAALNIRFELPVPFGGIEFREPAAKGGSLLRTELLNCFFQFRKRCHIN